MKIVNLKDLLLLVVFQILTMAAFGQKNFRTTYYEQRRTLFEKLPNNSREIIFLGNSITDGGEWSELLKNKRVKNRGISGDVTEGILYRLTEVTESKPAKVFLLIGINDLAWGISKDTVFENICRIAIKIKKDSPKTKVYIQSLLPVNPFFDKFPQHCSKTSDILWINQKLNSWCSHTKIQYVDLFVYFKNQENNWMNPVFSNDGLHLIGDGYLKWIEIISHYI